MVLNRSNLENNDEASKCVQSTAPQFYQSVHSVYDGSAMWQSQDIWNRRSYAHMPLPSYLGTWKTRAGLDAVKID